MHMAININYLNFKKQQPEEIHRLHQVYKSMNQQILIFFTVFG